MALDIQYLKSAVHPPDFPKADRPEVALAGRSNAGKSSFLNAISKKSVAHVSQEPGKTRLLNFFDVGKSYRLVDMPGYGFAKRGGGEMESWTQMIETYLSTRENLVGLVLLMDLRRDWSEDEELLAQFLRDLTLPFCVVGTKSDKITQTEIRNRVQYLKKKTGHESIFPVSNQKKVGTEEVEEFVYSHWVAPFRGKKS